MESRVCIVGGGIGGLTAALALQRQGIDALVFEREQRYGRVGAGITLAPNAMCVLDELGVADRIIAAGNALSYVGAAAHRGQRLSRVPLDKLKPSVGGHTVVAIHRAALQDILLQALAPNSVQMGQRFVGLQQSEGEVTARFESGRAQTAALLVGCDGIGSRVRASLFGKPTLRYSGQFCWRGICPTPADQHRGASVDTFLESWGPGLRFGHVDVGSDQTYWYATRAQPEDAPAIDREQLRTYFDGWHAPACDYIGVTDADTIIGQGLYDVAPTREWSKGRAVLLGDAVHPTTPNMGQGACMAIESASVLGQALGQGASIGQAVARYVGTRRPRTGEITRASWQIGQLANWRNPIACGVRNTMMRMAPSSLLIKRLRAIYTYPLLPVHPAVA